MLIREILLWGVPIVGTLMGVTAATHALLVRRDSRSALGWIVASLWIPFVGPLLYLAFGVNRVRQRAIRLFGAPRHRLFPGPLEHALAPDDLPPCDAVGDHLVDFQRVGRALSGRSALGGHALRILRNGDEAYPAMIAAIEAAETSVRLCSYIFDPDAAGQRFIAALGAAAARGVDVKVLIDGIGGLYGRRRAAPQLRAAGVDAVVFLPPRILPFNPLINLRNHRKTLCVDGRVAFTGGMNIGDRHLVGDGAGRMPTAELHFEVRGPAVAQLEQVFANDFKFAARRDVEVTPAPPADPVPGAPVCRVVEDGPDDGIDKLVLLLIAAISNAQDRVMIMTPYFLPPRELMVALGAAALHGVQVDVVLPQKSNLRYVDWATQKILWEPLSRGVRIWRAAPPFEHSKLVVIDESWTLIGSANLDARSLRLNFELGVEVYDDEFAIEVAAHIDASIATAHRLTLQEMDGRSFWVRIRDALCWLWSPYL